MNHAIHRTNWPAIALLFTAGLLAAMQFAKVSPIMQAVATDLVLSPVLAGLAVSILGLVGVVFAIAVGSLVNAIGLMRGLQFALFGGGVIAVLGAFAEGGGLFLVSRLCEGFSHLLIVVCAPALMADLAVAKDKPIALALWGCFFGVGFAIVSLVQQPIVDMFGWRGLLVIHGIAMLTVGAMVHFTLRHQNTVHGQGLPSLQTIGQAHVDVFSSGAPLLLALTFWAYTVLFLATLTFLKDFLLQTMSWKTEHVGPFLALAAVTTLCFTLLAGVFSRRGVTPLQGFTVAFVGLAISALIVFALQPAKFFLVFAILVMMMGFGLLPGFTFASMPVVAKTREKAALGFSAIALFGNVGTFLGTPIFAAIKQSAGWPGIAIFICAICAVGVGLAVLLDRAIRRNATP